MSTLQVWRSLRRSPAFTAAAILTLGLGIGLNAAVSSAVRGVLLRPFDLPRPERLIVVRQDLSARGGKRDDYAGWAEFAAWRARNRCFAALAAHGGYAADLSSLDPPENVVGAAVSHEFFAVLGVRPLLGRDFLAGEEVKGDDGVAILSHSLWSRRFGADPAVIGRTITVTGRQRIIVGVLPSRFVWPLKPEVELWVPQWTAPPLADWGSAYVGVVGRLREGVDAAAARAEMDRVGATLAADHPAELRGVGVTLLPLLDAVVGPARQPLWLLFGAAGLVLLLACLNVANLCVARATAGGAEHAMRLALGAGRGPLARRFLAEGLLLGAGGAVAGLLLGGLCLALLRGLAPPQTPRLDAVRLDGAVAGWSLLLSLLAGLAAGGLPALWFWRQHPFGLLRAAAGGSPPRGALRLRGVLIVAEIAASILLVGGAAMLLRSLAALGRVDPGFRTEKMVFGVLNVLPRHPPDRRDIADFVAQLEEGLRARPEIAAVGMVSSPPLTQAANALGVVVDGQGPADERRQTALWSTASPGYFKAFGIPLATGRLFDPADRPESPPVAIVNQQFVRRYLGGRWAVGRRLRSDEAEGPEGPWRQIVGVVGDLHGLGLDRPPEPEVYLAISQRPTSRVTAVARATGSTAAALAALQEVAKTLRPGQVVGQRQTMQEVLDRGLSPRRFAAGLTATFAGVALLLAAVGIYGVTALAVAERRRELAVRQALGAAPREVAAVVLRWCGRLLAAGVAAGLCGWLAMSRLLAGLLFEVRPMDGWSIATAVGFLALASLAAAAAPAWRAVRIDAARVLSGGL